MAARCICKSKVPKWFEYLLKALQLSTATKCIESRIVLLAYAVKCSGKFRKFKTFSIQRQSKFIQIEESKKRKNIRKLFWRSKQDFTFIINILKVTNFEIIFQKSQFVGLRGKKLQLQFEPCVNTKFSYILSDYMYYTTNITNSSDPEFHTNVKSINVLLRAEHTSMQRETSLLRLNWTGCITICTCVVSHIRFARCDISLYYGIA